MPTDRYYGFEGESHFQSNAVSLINLLTFLSRSSLMVSLQIKPSFANMSSLPCSQSDLKQRLKHQYSV